MIQKKVGLLGGTFDPVHKGHIQLGQAAKAEFELDEIILIPAAEPPHKNSSKITPFSHRCSMLSLVCEENEGFKYSTIEEKLPRPSYTIDTLFALNIQNTADISYYFIIGSDAFLELHQWKSYRQLISEINLIIARREGDSFTSIKSQLDRLGYFYEDRQWILPESCKKAFLLETVPLDCSATRIKSEILRGSFSRRCLTDNVLTYIRKNKLFLETAPERQSLTRDAIESV